MNVDLQDYRDREFDVGGLVGAVREILQRTDAAPSDGRVAAYPDERTLRYYQSIGIIRAPARYEGRTAIYGYTHLLQVVAVKLLQAQGLSLAQIQRAIANATQGDIEAAVTEALSPLRGRKPGAEPPTPQTASLAARGERLRLGRLEIGAEGSGPGSEGRPRGAPRRELTAVEVAPGVSVVIDPEIVDTPEEIITRIQRELDTVRGEE